jgi:hypothetical protein
MRQEAAGENFDAETCNARICDCNISCMAAAPTFRKSITRRPRLARAEQICELWMQKQHRANMQPALAEIFHRKRFNGRLRCVTR